METTPTKADIHYSARDLGLAYADAGTWTLALIHLQRAARLKQLAGGQDLISDVVLLDALGEAAYQCATPEALGPYQNYYKYPKLATHMARAFLVLGDVASAKEFLGYAKDSALKAALWAMTEMGSDIKKTAEFVLPVARTYPDLYYPEYWRALAAVADAVKDTELTQLAERKSKEFAYKDPNIHFNQALRMLGQGQFQAGWRLYEWRLVPGAAQNNRTELGTIPMWEGETLKPEESLLIFLEQGLGDCLFSLRYIQYFLDRNISIQIAARPGLIDLVKTSFPGVPVRNEDDIAEIDYWQKEKIAPTFPQPHFWCYSLSVPYRAHLIEPQFTTAYLKIADPLKNRVAEQIQKMNPENLPVYCINWHGRIDTEADRTRAFSEVEFFQAAGLDQIRCFVISVQKDATFDEVTQLQKLTKKNNSLFLNAAPQLDSFSDTGAFLLASDRLITNDTSVAHLAGALGHPTTVLARNKAIWQWLRRDHLAIDDTKIEKSVWYDSVDIQYAMTPEISWLFTTIYKKNSKDLSTKEEQNDHHIQSTELQPGNLRKKIRFAGRTDA